VRLHSGGSCVYNSLSAALSLLSDEYLSAWLDRACADIQLWGTQDDPRNAPPAPPVVAVGGWGTGNVWGGGMGWGAGNVWAGGWGNANGPLRKRRWFPRVYGYRRMGAVFLLPRPKNWRERHRRRYTWLRRLEREWRTNELLLSLQTTLTLVFAQSSYSVA
jgi:hypothetical protein